MRKITKLILVAVALIAGSTSFGQIRKTNMSFTLVSPAENFVVLPNVPFTVTVKVTNNGPDNFRTGDTMIFATNISADLLPTILTAPLNSGQSLNLNLMQLTNNGDLDSNTTVDFCARVLDINTADVLTGGVPLKVSYSDLDTTNNDDCNKITLKKNSTSIFDFNDKKKDALIISPNPASDKITIKLDLARAQKIQISVRDITGREVMHKDFGKIQAGSNAQLSLDISALRPGMYIVEMNGGELKAVGRFTKS